MPSRAFGPQQPCRTCARKIARTAGIANTDFIVCSRFAIRASCRDAGASEHPHHGRGITRLEAALTGRPGGLPPPRSGTLPSVPVRAAPSRQFDVWGQNTPVAFTNQLRAVIFLAKLFAVDVDGVVAQLAERLVRNEKVAGSIPVGSTSLRFERSEMRRLPRRSAAKAGQSQTSPRATARQASPSDFGLRASFGSRISTFGFITPQ